MKLRKLTALSLALILVLSLLASCAKEPAATEPAATVPASAPANTQAPTTAAPTTAEHSAETEPAPQTEPAAPAEEHYTIDNIRDYVIGLDEPVELSDGSKTVAINFDNAATTPALAPVADEISKQLLSYGSIGRGASQKSSHSTELYKATREKVVRFVGGDPETYTCFYVNNTTDGLNKLASALITDENMTVLTTRIEHHSNDLSWRERCNVIYAEVDDLGRVRYDEIERLLNENHVDIVSVSAASNVTGYVTDVHRIAKLAHEHGALMVVDGAQIVAHRAFSMLGETPEENIDFLAFSAHKMYSPYGGGAVVGLMDVLNEHMPEVYGGGTIRIVRDEEQTYTSAPAKYEAGSPNYPAVVGLGKAIDVLEEVGFDAIQAHEQVLMQKMIEGLKQIDGVMLYGDCEHYDDRVGVITFRVQDVNSDVLANQISGLGGVAIRRGAFCAHPYVWRLLGITDEEADFYNECTDSNTPGLIRISFGIYNTEEEVDRFLEMLPGIIEAAKEAQLWGNYNPNA